MRFCRNCGGVINDDEKFCRNCGMRVDGQQDCGQPQNAAPQNNGAYNYGAPPKGPKKDNTKTVVIAILAVCVVLIVVMAFILPNIVTVEQPADYEVKMKISGVSISDTKNGFKNAVHDSSGRLHTYLIYRCNSSAEMTHELGWCKTDGTMMDIANEWVTFDVVSEQSKINMSIFLVVVTKVLEDGTNHYDYVDLYDVTDIITQEKKPTGDHNYGVTGVSFYISDLSMKQATFTGDSQPNGTITLTFDVTKK